MDLFSFGKKKKKEEGESEVAKLRKVYETELGKWKKWLKEYSGKEPPEFLAEVEQAQEQLKNLLNTANENGGNWDNMISLANSVKYAAIEYSNATERGRLSQKRDAIKTVEILEQLKAEQDKEEEHGGGRRKRKSKKVKKSKKSKKPKRSRRGKKQIKKTKKYKKRSNKKRSNKK